MSPALLDLSKGRISDGRRTGMMQSLWKRPGGMTAALYTSRANLKTLILEECSWWKLLKTLRMQKTILVQRFLSQNQPTICIKVRCNLAQGMQHSQFQIGVEGIVKVITAGKKTYYAYAVVIATGSYHRKLSSGKKNTLAVAFILCGM